MPPNPLVLLAAVIVVLALGGCGRSIPSPADLPIVYKIDVQQGNVVTQEMLSQLQPGMEKAKVRYIMGTPLIVDVFHQDRWDYVYTMQERGGKRSQRTVSLFFKDDRLDHVEGDVKPGNGALATTGRQATTVEVPEEKKGFVSRLTDRVTGGEDGKNDAKKEAPAQDVAEKAPQPPSESTEAPADAATEASAGDFVIDNGAGAAPAPARETETPMATTEAAPSGRTEDALMMRFQSESNLEDAVLEDDTSSAAARAAEAAAGADGVESTATPAAGSGGVASSATEVTIPDDAPPPPKKGFFRRMLEKVGVGDNEEGEYESADTKYKDPSNQEFEP